MGKEFKIQLDKHKIIIYLRIEPSKFDDREKELLIAAVTLARSQVDLAVRILDKLILYISKAMESGQQVELPQPIKALLKNAFRFEFGCESPALSLARIRLLFVRFQRIKSELFEMLEIVDLNPTHVEKFKKQYAEKGHQFIQEGKDKTHNISAIQIENNNNNNNNERTLVQVTSAPYSGVAGYVRMNAGGRVHISFLRLYDTEGTAWTIIHEASHKFIKTEDHSYVHNNGTWANSEMTISESLGNADSFALFAMGCEASMLPALNCKYAMSTFSFKFNNNNNNNN